MEVTTIEYKHCDMIKIRGRIDSSTAAQLSDALDSVIDQGRFKIVIDMSDVEYMSSAGLRVLIGAQKSCKRYNRGEIVLALVPKRIYDALELAGFVPLFRFHDDLLAAVGSF